jgi:hypothetical protein
MRLELKSSVSRFGASNLLKASILVILQSTIASSISCGNTICSIVLNKDGI